MALGDMFLKIETQRQGAIKGEAFDEKHQNEIDVVSWAWGMRAQTAMAGAGGGSKATLDELEIVKRVDSASTGLMAAMRNNDAIKAATLTVRKAGGTPFEYFRILVQKGRITAISVEVVGTELIERLTLSFQRISVEYTPQGADGLARGGMTFETEIT
jgi:type VI secretion system secreted protein Hcp